MEHCQRYEPPGEYFVKCFAYVAYFIKVELSLPLPLPMAMIMAMIICRRVWHMSILKVFAIVLIMRYLLLYEL